jgi:hypothetical protein
MDPSPTSIEAARAAKASARLKFAGRPDVVGIGLTRRGAGYAIKINVSAPGGAALPLEWGGVPVVTEVVGEVRKR